MRIERALLSVYDKTGIVDLARTLAAAGTELVSSGGTATTLREAGLDVKDVSEITGFPEMLDGRVKTLHPAVHGGILADRSKPDHLETLEAHGIGRIDLVVVNLYPFASAPGVELIDVGGPTMVRAAAKNHDAVAVVVDPADYGLVAKGETTLEQRRALAAKAFASLSAYDARIAAWLGGDDVFTMSGEKVSEFRYGENPHQTGAVFRTSLQGLTSAEQIHGMDLSYCNWLDLDAAFGLSTAFDDPAACIIKHTSPCGVAAADTIDDAYRLAFECDTRAAFGGIAGLNRSVTKGVAELMREVYLHCIIAPDFEPDALAILTAKKNLRLLKLPRERWGAPGLSVRTISGGLLVQTPDLANEDPSTFRVVTKRQPTEAEMADMLFAWKVCAYVRSNTIVVGSNRTAFGVGAGQMSRVEAFQLAVQRAGDRSKGAVAASDALFPFPDNVDVAAEAGITAIIQTGGSVKDDEVIAAADAAGIAMVLTGFRHFRH